jgi:RNA recognition motif-containing protein
LQKLFEGHGQVTGVDVIEDQYTGKARGFAFVEMSTREEALAAIQALNEKTVNGRPLTVNEARPRNDRNAGGGGARGGRPRSNYNRYR